MDEIDLELIKLYKSVFETLRKIDSDEHRFAEFDLHYDNNFVNWFNSRLLKIDDITDSGGDLRFLPIKERNRDVSIYIDTIVRRLDWLLSTVK